VAFVAGCGSCALAQDGTIDRIARGEAGKDIRVGVYTNVQPNCTSGPLPSIRLSTAPAHGKITVKKGKIDFTNYKQCLALQVPAYIAFYKSQRDFSGNDVFALEVTFADGKMLLQRVTVTIAAASGGSI
jgi:hypothetical protein